MKKTRFAVAAIMWVLSLVAVAQSGLESTGAGGGGRNRPQRDAQCDPELEYLHGNICCLKCPAGKFVKSHCQSSGEMGRCDECDFGTFTEHENGFSLCMLCTRCRSDQVLVRSCASNRDSECRCEPGLFCDPDHACEVCKKCSRCKDDEIKVGNCTHMANTMCKKTQQQTGTHRGVIAGIVVLVVIGIIIAILGAVFWKRKKHATKMGLQNSPDELSNVIVDDTANHSLEERQNRQNRNLDDYQLPLLSQQVQAVRAKASSSEDEDSLGLGDSLHTSASNSQHSLPGQISALLSTTTPQPSPEVPRVCRTRTHSQLPSLVPVNGEKSLRKCFDFFVEVDVDYHKRFFRGIGLKDNDVKIRDHLDHEDRIHELLCVWIEKMGKEASLNDLLNALLALNQRLTAEKIMDQAISNGHYEYEKEQEVNSSSCLEEKSANESCS